jgi:glycosyltransferase involved in cell wall biosynthesis
MGPESQPGGLNRYYYHMVRALAAEGHVIHGFVWGRDFVLREPHLEIIGLGGSVSQRIREGRRAVRACLQRAPIDVVNVHFALVAAPVVDLARRRRLPLVVNFQGPWSQELWVAGAGVAKSAVAKGIERYVYKASAAFVVLSHAFKQILSSEYRVPAERIHVIPPGVDIERFRPPSEEERRIARRTFEVADDDWVLVTVRRLQRRMGLDLLIRAVKDLTLEYPHLRLLIAGAGPMAAELRTLIEAESLQGVVRLLGFVPDPLLPTLYQTADLTVVPSIQLEGFGLTILESLATGVPVLGTRVGGIPEVLAPLDAQLLVEAGSAKALATGIDSLIRSRQRWPSKDLCRRYAEQFAWPVAAKHVVEVFRAAGAEGNRGPLLASLSKAALDAGQGVPSIRSEKQ